MWNDSLIHVKWLTHTYDMTHSYMWHDSFICATWLMYICDMTHSCVTWPTHICDMTHSYMWHDSFTCESFFFKWCHELIWFFFPAGMVLLCGSRGGKIPSHVVARASGCSLFLWIVIGNHTHTNTHTHTHTLPTTWYLYIIEPVECESRYLPTTYE